MSTEAEPSKVLVEEFARRVRREMVPVGKRFSYFSALPVAEEDLRQYLNDPLAAVSPAVTELLPNISIVLAPFLEKGNGKSGEYITYERPAEGRQLYSVLHQLEDMMVLALSVKEIEVADYHYQLYAALAVLTARRWPPDMQERFYRALREELNAEVHGEVDEKSWHLKQALLRRQTNIRKETKLFREYARQSFEDTLTLYLHGTCCDIDIETGPRQMPSRYLRKRLELLLSIFPPPEGYAVLPEHLKTR